MENLKRLSVALVLSTLALGASVAHAEIYNSRPTRQQQSAGSQRYYGPSQTLRQPIYGARGQYLGEAVLYLENGQRYSDKEQARFVGAGASPLSFGLR